MKQRQPERIEYRIGEESAVLRRLYRSRDPLVLRVEGFPSRFDLDYYRGAHDSDSSFYEFDAHGRQVRHERDRFTSIIRRIEADEPIRIFGEFVANDLDAALLDAIPLWKAIPPRPRYFVPKAAKPLYFFGGRGAHTGLHHDHELNDILHVCLHGRKRLLLFKYEESHNLYKVPFFGESLVDLRQPLSDSVNRFPGLENATCYDVTMSPGDMLYMPKRCWHYVEYLEHNASATLAFYPRKADQLWGTVLGVFYLGFGEEGLRLNRTAAFRRFAERFARSTGVRRRLLVGVEWCAFALLWPLCAAGILVSLSRRGRLY